VLVHNLSGCTEVTVLVRRRSGCYGIYIIGTQSAQLVRTLKCLYAIRLVGMEVIVLVRNRSGWYGS